MMEWFDIPTKSSRHTSHPFLMPHAFFGKYFHERPNEFSTVMSGAAGACYEFWDSIKDTEFVKQHPDLTESTWHRTVPLGMHGDAGAFAAHDSLYVLSYISLMGRGTTMRKRFLFTVLRKSEMVADTLDHCLRIMSWSFNSLLSGEHPQVDAFGRKLQAAPRGPIAGPWRAALSQIRGDWAFYTEIFRFPKWNENIRMCWQCRASATVPHLAYTDHREEAAWRDTLFTHDSYMHSPR
jgi:hypothetical protein